MLATFHVDCLKLRDAYELDLFHWAIYGLWVRSALNRLDERRKISRRMLPQTPYSQPKENGPPRPNTISRIYSSSGDSTLITPEIEALGNPRESHDTVGFQSAGFAEPSSGEDQSSQAMNDENQSRQTEVRSSEEKKGSRKRRAADNEYFEFDWDDELRAEGHLHPLPQPRSHEGPHDEDEEVSVDAHSHFLAGGESPISLDYLRQIGLRDEMMTDRSTSPRHHSTYGGIILEQRENAEVFASNLQHKLEEISKHRSPEIVTDRNLCRSTDVNPPDHRESGIKKGSYIAIENNGRVVPCIYIDGSEFVMEVDVLDARKMGWTKSDKSSLVHREKLICVLKHVEPHPQPKSKSAEPIQVLIFSEPLF